jgi:DNA-binding NarL/FixJ family response regulator
MELASSIDTAEAQKTSSSPMNSWDSRSTGLELLCSGSLSGASWAASLPTREAGAAALPEPLTPELHGHTGLDALLRGSLRIEGFARDSTGFRVQLVVAGQRHRVELLARELRIFESLLRGRSQKQIGLEFDVSAATVSGSLRRVVRKLGASRWEQLVATACALAHDAPLLDRQFVAVGGSPGLEIRATLHPRALSLLTGAERDVAVHVLEGCSNAQIAQLRRTSVRTIANQMASITHKLEVRGRLELILALVLDGSPLPIDHELLS